MYNIIDFGVVADGVSNDTRCIQAAIDECSIKGGTVHFPPGSYRVGTIMLKSNVRIFLDMGCTLLGSTDVGDYSTDVRLFTDAVQVERGITIFYGENIENISIFGKGVIDGRGGCFSQDKPRPMILRFLNCNNVAIENIALKDSGAWVQHYLFCDNVTVRGVHVSSNCNGNNDGINIDGCHGVMISDSHFSSGDDAITLKCTTARKCKDVVITNCLVNSDCNGIKFGTESIGGFENISISNCVIYNTRLSGISLLSMDGANLENVVISNISMNKVGTPIFIRLGKRGYSSNEEKNDKPVGCIRNISISNIQAQYTDKIGGSITGLPGYNIQGVVLSNLRITYGGNGPKEDAVKEVSELPAEYPDHFMYGVLPAYGLFCRHVKGLIMQNVRFDYEQEDYRPAIIFDDVEDLEINGFKGTCGSISNGLIQIKNSRDAFIHGCFQTAPVKKFLTVEGAECRNIQVVWNSLKKAEIGLEVKMDVPAGEVVFRDNIL